MRKLLVLLALVSACRSTGSAPARTPAGVLIQTGAATPRAAVEAFLASVRAEDLQAMSLVWGTADGPARELMAREDMEKREIVMMCFFKHDALAMRGDSPLAGGRRVLSVELTRKESKRTTSFTTVQAKTGRWYVLQADIEPVRDWCNGGR